LDCGPETRHALASFEMRAGIVADSISGLVTEADLRREFAAL
jgi:hypothetical protein